MDAISVLGIFRGISRRSHVLFEQFLGRGLRRMPGEPSNLSAVVVSPQMYHQRRNFEDYVSRDLAFEEAEPEDDENEDEESVTSSFNEEDIDTYMIRRRIVPEEMPRKKQVNVIVEDEEQFDGTIEIDVPITRTELIALLEKAITTEYGLNVMIHNGEKYEEAPFFIYTWQDHWILYIEENQRVADM
eukprot:gb/GECH01006927.1/.p1 GENE.gb/GECH01006927.1/~~gb/GECH01006927.1/.p1  ORF type:complete len:187 (+),score=33.93 gb/GECH01006927.1/:1-561(+)